MYNYVGSTVLGSSVGALLGFRPGVNTGWEEMITVDISPGGASVAYLVNSDGV